ncbi:MAG TPA: Gfo/Idh/MocA family oxidoreductase [Patescibacteria group bacterium]|nr:Gfo/Idh/MocA family oxidoreductase [Patescibacteria group bacterium]
MKDRIRVAVAGVGDFGRQHARVYAGLEEAQLVGVFDANPERAAAVAREFGTEVIENLEAVAQRAQAASVAVPTVEHASVGCRLLDHGVDVLVEKPIASSLAEADQLIGTARRCGRILQIGHVERFNPAVAAAAKVVDGPLFFEVHRLGVFTPRSLDVDVVYDLMIHDLDILLALAGPVEEAKAVGIPVVTDKVDIAHVRLEFATGAVANVTASRISTERVRKLRFFQRREYVSVDYARRDALRIRVAQAGPEPRFEFEKLPVEAEEPLRAELRAFLEASRTRNTPVVDGTAGRKALELADRVMASIGEHARKVRVSVAAPQATP